MAAKFEIRSAGPGKFTWVLVSQGRTLASGEPYARRAMAEKAIGSLRNAVAGATVADLTMKPKTAPAKAAAVTTKATKPARAASKPRKAAGKTTPVRKTAAARRSKAAG